jgi:uncharacterized FlgJ-related protein
MLRQQGLQSVMDEKTKKEFTQALLIFIGTIIFFVLLSLWSYYRVEPAFKATTEKEFIDSVNKCVDHLERNIPYDQRINRQLIVTKAALESNYGRSRFAIEGNNLLGIRQFYNLEAGMLPNGVKVTANWRVARFDSKCDSIKYYINLLNTNHHYEEFRKERTFQLSNNLNIPTRYFIRLEKYATNPLYSELLMKTYNNIYVIKS